MEDYEIVVKNNSEVLKVKLPGEVIDKIKQMSELNDGDFEKSANEKIMQTIISSLDSMIYAFDNMKPHPKTSTSTAIGEITHEKTENGNKE